MPKISVIICTYNPDELIFSRCLERITSASKILAPYEILIIDNNSPSPVKSNEYVREFAKTNIGVRIIEENEQGLTPARIRGLRESAGELIIFIDDDNFIMDNYFAVASEIFEGYPFIGAYSGQVTLEYDKEPEQWTKKYWGMLVYRQLNKNVWSNLLFNNDTMPYGAGLCIRRDVGEHYVKLVESGKRNFNLDRSKGSLMSGGDNDLAMCACDIGKGMGVFKDLLLKHYIPSGRFTLDYLTRLAYGIYYSSAVLQYMRTGKIDRSTIPQKIKHLIRLSIMNKNDRVIQLSSKRGLKDAIKMIQSNGLA